MTRDELEHAIRAACDITEDDEVYVFGSQAILGQFPNPPAALLMSAEADVSPKTRIDAVERLNSIGEGSDFHRSFGFYVHGLPITEAAKLPANWSQRTIPVRNRNTGCKTGLCVEVHDLAASKLAAFREKDRHFVRVLVAERLLKPRTLIARIRRLPPPVDVERLVRWVDATVRDLR